MSTAAALRMAAYDVLTGNLCGIPQRSSDTLRGQIATDRGIGQDLVLRYLEGVPGVIINTINEDLASLKTSGNYARIIARVRDQITAEKERLEAEAGQRWHRAGAGVGRHRRD